jgi:precorrin-8X/cobalt-precorrin-8 methylmutase
VFDYEKIPAEIYRQSFETIHGEADLARFSPAERQLVIRLIHACGMVDLAEDVVISNGAVDAGIEALGRGADIICDVEMVRRGIIADRLRNQNNLLCQIGSDEARAYSIAMKTTRSAGAMETLKHQIPDAIIAIGNAPTALFRLLELVAGGLQPPALIIGCPVGFVGAVESKQALIEKAGADIPFITVRGRRGGSAIAAAAVNALAGLLSDRKSGEAKQ